MGSRHGRLQLATLVLFLASCGSPAPSAASTRSAAQSAIATGPRAASPIPPAKSQLATADSRYGRIIVDATGRTLYLFDIEHDSMARCYDACAVNWPPLRATSAATSDPRLNDSLIAVTQRKNGSPQLTYNGHPLYYYVGDRSAGEIKCQAVIEFGGGWYVIDSRGNKITTR